MTTVEIVKINSRKCIAAYEMPYIPAKEEIICTNGKCWYINSVAHYPERNKVVLLVDKAPDDTFYSIL